MQQVASLLVGLTSIFFCLWPPVEMRVKAQLVDSGWNWHAKSEKHPHIDILKFKIVDSGNCFLLPIDSINKYEPGFFRKGKHFEVVYGPGKVDPKFGDEVSVKMKNRSDLQKYPIHYLMEIKRLN